MRDLGVYTLTGQNKRTVTVFCRNIVRGPLYVSIAVLMDVMSLWLDQGSCFQLSRATCQLKERFW